MLLEEAGIPSVAVHTDVFAGVARATANANGMPRTRQAFVPQPVVDLSRAELRAYIEGNDPISGRPFMREVIEALTGPLDAEDLTGLSFDRSASRLLSPDSEEDLQQLFLQNHWTDCLPITLPTEARVAAMLKGTSHAADESVGRMRPTSFREFWEYSVEKVAVNAVMAGARPDYFPVILALAASGSTARSSSTTSMTNMAVVNGPIRHQIGMNCGLGALGPYNHANVTIGRAYALLSQNLQARCRAKPIWGHSATGSPTVPALLKMKSAAPGSRCTSKKASSRRIVPSACFSGCVTCRRDTARV